MGRLDGKVCVITGAGGGMGREAALAFHEEGARVCVADVDGEAAEGTAARVPRGVRDRASTSPTRTSVRDMYAATADRYGGIDVLYNNAGISPADDASILDTEPEAWDRVLDVNAKGVYLCCKHGHPLSARARRRLGDQRRVVRGARRRRDLADRLHGVEGRVLSLSRELAVQFARAGVRVNALCPGPGRDALAAADLRRRPGRLRAAAHPSADGPAREAARDRQRRALPRERRVVVRHGVDVPRRRRPDGRVRHSE